MSSRRSICLALCAAFALAASSFAAPIAAELAGASTSLPMPLTREKLLASLGTQLSSHFNFEGDLDLELLQQWSPPAQVASNWTIEITEYPTVASSAMMIRCRVLADAAVVAQPSFVLRAALWRDAWASKVPLTPNTTFDPSELETRRVDLLKERDALPAAVGDRSYIFTRGLPAGRLLNWRDLSRRPLVKRGEMVEVSAVEGTLVVTMKALAMENGAQGDTVTVRNPESRRDFSAQVVDENHVQVKF
jgi:flagella basal body P-ring formation protein FlgA